MITAIDGWVERGAGRALPQFIALAVAAAAAFLTAASAHAAVSVCGDAFVPTFNVQGSNDSTPEPGALETEGIVVADHEGAAPALGGFFIQDPGGDANTATSDGLFAAYSSTENLVSVGDRVRVAGTVSEVGDQTQIAATSVAVCSTGNPVPAATVLTLPLPSPTSLERYEGMFVTFSQTLSVTDTSHLMRFGTVVLSSGGRLAQPTNVAQPGAAAIAMQASNDLNRLLVDDAWQAENHEPIVFGRGGLPLSASNTLRAGDTVAGVAGVMTQTSGGHADSPTSYRLRPVQSSGSGWPNLSPTNARPSGPGPRLGNVRVASVILANYFNTFSGCTAGVGGAPTPCRGANTQAEFDRQANKLVAAVLASDADVLALTEIENDGYGTGAAIRGLVNKLNFATAAGTYAFVNADAATGQVNALGTHGVKVGIVYRPDAVLPVGTTAVLSDAAYVNGGDSIARNHPSLTQAFSTIGHGTFVLSVNHLKDRATACDAADAGDGQGECNAVRTAAATRLLAWLASNPTGTGDPDVLMTGGLNSFALEDPMITLTDGGFTDLVAANNGDGAYSSGSNGQWGSLDQALGSAGLISQVGGAAPWHINADEPSALDYNVESKSAKQLTSLYAEDAFRSAAADPLVVDLQLVPSSRLHLSAATYTVKENAHAATVTVKRAGTLLGSVSVDYATTAGTAIDGADFSATSGTLLFEEGVRTRSFSVPILGDTTTEKSETIKVALSAPTPGANLALPSRGVLTISASDQQPDALVSNNATSGYAGNNIYNGTGTNQSMMQSAQRTVTRTFYVRVSNDGNATNTFALKGTLPKPDSTVRYFLGSTDVTAAMQADVGRPVTVAPGAFKLVTVRIRATSAAAIGSTKAALVTATWRGDAVRKDAAKAVLKVTQ